MSRYKDDVNYSSVETSTSFVNVVDGFIPNVLQLDSEGSLNITGTYKINGFDVIGSLQLALDEINGEVI